LKIVHYVGALTRSAGGLFFSVSGMAKALRGREFEIDVIGGADRHFEDDRGQWGDVQLHPHPLGHSYGFDPRVLALIRNLRPDVMHVHGLWSAASIYGRAATAMGIPTVVSPHGMLDPWILARRPAVKAVHAALFERPLLRRAHVHALSEAERTAVTAFLPATRGRTFVLPNGVPAAPAHDASAPRAGALYLGRLHAKKQVLELIAAWDRVSGGERLTVAGWGDAEYEAAVRAAAANAANVDFVGALHGDAKIDALARTKWFILPSLSEGLPMAVLEAIQHGGIPIVTDQCNLPELFEHGIALRMEHDFSDFAAAIGQARSFAPDEAARRSEAARFYARRYSWEVIGDAMMNHYRQIVAEAASTAR
jgi:poly(glycerol-phosphate) alpha-glucosyltransferase